MTTTGTLHRTELLRVEGVVQGVGFRPFVQRLATGAHLDGWVRNTSGAVEIAVEGDAAAIERFIESLHTQAPRLAHIEQVTRLPLPELGLRGFTVVASETGPGTGDVPPDAAICPACTRELFDPSNRRYRYPFITCTDCGPRFSVIDALPYDRARTSMRAFTQCPACAAEYADPGDRRFHSESNSCPACGPRLWLADETGHEMVSDRLDAIREAARIIINGGIVAVRGLGGYHLACDATNDDAVRRLRTRKHRDAKPLAVMVADDRGAVQLARRDGDAHAALHRAERPVVVMRRHSHTALAASVSPGLDSVGIVLAYTPLHHLLLQATRRPLVMTSGNRSDEPTATGNAEAVLGLAGIADAFLMHDRDIVTRYDDSVVRAAVEPIVIRRARGLAPLPLRLPVATPKPLVAVGPHLKNTLTIADGGRAWTSQHIGDLEDLAGLEAWRAVLARHQQLFRIAPRVVVRDKHPGYLSSRIAADLGLERTIEVQHHHAHIAAVAAEHDVTAPVVGLAFDGTGYGDDGSVWGAEVLVADLTSYRRRGHLRSAPLPGGDVAARKPWRAAAGYASLARECERDFALAFDGVPTDEYAIVEQMMARHLNAPLGSSMGRLFDAAAAMLGLRRESDYEGQAAMELEALAGRTPAAPLFFPVQAASDGTWVMDPVPLLSILGARARCGADRSELAAAFHESVAEAAAEVARQVAAEEEIDVIALGGGTFQNARLLSRLRSLLEDDGFTVIAPRRLPPNDGAISFGQAAIAAALLAQEA